MKKKEKKLEEEIAIPEGTSITIDRGIVTVKGKKGDVKKRLLHQNVTMESKDSKLVFKTKRSTKREKKMIGSFKSHIRNMIKGANEGCVYKLKICSGHFPMNISADKDKFTVKNFLGEKIPRVLKIKEGANVKVDGSIVTVDGVDKEIVSQVAAAIELLTRRVNYDLRIFQDGIYIVSKDGKEIK